jgi:protein arginine kinase activator
MKCQRCEKQATFHITELEGGKHQELHLCEEHAKQYLTQGESESSGSSSLTGALAQQLAVSQTAEELEKLDKKACPVCGITFYEFRNQGRLGCPHDYIFFEKELEPLVANIHGETIHTGKRPKRFSGGTQRKTELIRLRREMKEAIGQEDYEQAGQIRDQIRRIEESTDD